MFVTERTCSFFLLCHTAYQMNQDDTTNLAPLKLVDPPAKKNGEPKDMQNHISAD